MPRIAIFADIHGNLPALEAVLDDLAGQGVDEVLVGGDLVGRGPQGSAVVQRVAELGLPSVLGNHEEYLLAFRHRTVPAEWLETEEWAASRWMAAELDEAAVGRITAFPFALVAGTAPQLRLVHGSPRSNQEGLGPWCSSEELEDHWARVEEPILVCAHTHRPLTHEAAGGGMVVNVGAVGLPFNRDRRAQYAILDGEGDRWRLERRAVAYDVDRTLTVYRDSGFLDQGGITARLLRLELEHATPFLVPFLAWTEVAGVPAESSQLDPFLQTFDPTEPLRTFFARLYAGGRSATSRSVR